MQAIPLTSRRRFLAAHKLQWVELAGHSHLPSFDHNLKDPVENDIEVTEAHRILIVEGNYLHLGEASLSPGPPSSFMHSHGSFLRLREG